MTQFQLKFKSFNPYYIQTAIEYICSIVNFFNVDKSRSLKMTQALKPRSSQMAQAFLTPRRIQIPTKIKKFTVLRSPHIDKSSREQFELRKYKKILQIEFSNQNYAIFFLHILKNSEFVGVELEVCMKFLGCYQPFTP